MPTKQVNAAAGRENTPQTAPLPRYYQTLRDAAAFRGLDDQTIAELAKHAVIRRLANGSKWISRRESAKGLALIVEGGLRSTSIMSDGREYVFSIMGVGDLWGMVSSIDGDANANDVYAYGETVLLTIGRPLVIKLINSNQAFALWLMQLLCKRLRMANTVVEDQMLQPLKVRTARLLISMIATESDAASKPATPIVVTQDTLRKLLGCSRPTINQQLKQFERDGLVHLEYGKVKITDLSGLRQICGDVASVYF